MISVVLLVFSFLCRVSLNRLPRPVSPGAGWRFKLQRSQLADVTVNNQAKLLHFSEVSFLHRLLICGLGFRNVCVEFVLLRVRFHVDRIASRPKL